MTARAWIDEVKEAVSRQLDRPVRVAELARAAGVHRVHLGRVFRETFGETIGDYHRRLRIAAAAGELDGDSSISEVAQRFGFADQAHFTRAFKRELGVTPSAYRADR